VTFPRLSQRTFVLSWLVGAIGIGAFLVTGWTAPAALGFLTIGLTDLYDIATRWRDPIATPRYSNVTIPGTTYRLSPGMEIGLETTSGLAFSVIGFFLAFNLI
jgi:hypothetical protein